MVDDAHGFGVLGASGRGSLEAAGLTASDVPVLMCTLGKAFGVFGAFVAGSETLIETLIQRGRSYIYTTALPPALAAAARAALAVQAEEGWRRERVLAHAARFLQPRLRSASSSCRPTRRYSRSLPAARLPPSPRAKRLLAEGLWVPAIRPPTVPPGRSRPCHVLGRARGCRRRPAARGARDPLPARSALMSTAGQADPRRPALVLLHGFALHSGLWGDGPPGCKPCRAASDRSARPWHAPLGPAHHGSRRSCARSPSRFRRARSCSDGRLAE